MQTFFGGSRVRRQHTRKRARALGSIPNTATVAFKQNNGMGYVMLNAATAKKYMLNMNDPIYHGGRRTRRRTRRRIRNRKN